MRNAFAQEIVTLADQYASLVLLSGDIGNRLFDPFKDKHEERFFNCGVAEANMMSVAAGMALSGLRPIAYTITPFVTTRCLEQIRDDVAYHNAPVLIVGVGSGLSYANLAGSHHSCEDIAFLRAIPNMTVLCPADANELRALLRDWYAHGAGPAYMRIGKKGEPLVHMQVPDLEIGDTLHLAKGSDCAILATGTLVAEAQEACTLLQQGGFSADLYSVPTVKPLNKHRLQSICQKHSLIVTVEEHSQIAGFGGAVAEFLLEDSHFHGRLERIGTPDRFFHQAGEQAYARQALNLDGYSIAKRIIERLCADAKISSDHCLSSQSTEVKTFLHENGVQDIKSVHVCCGGANNKVLAVTTSTGTKQIVKQYFRHPEDSRDRLLSEARFLQFAREQGSQYTAQLVAEDKEKGLCLHSFLPGVPCSQWDIDRSTVLEAGRFFIALNQNRTAATMLPDASEAAFSISQHIDLVERRMSALMACPAFADRNPAFQHFVQSELSVQWERVKATLLQQSKVHAIPLDQCLKDSQRCVSPSDFGFHNALIARSNTSRQFELYFVDFEYAGWDDPSRMICDFFSQVKKPVPLCFLDDFAIPVLAIFPEAELLYRRMLLLLPLYHIKWTCMLLNEFLMVDGSRRAFAQSGNHDNEKAKIRQLALAKLHLQMITEKEAIVLQKSEQESDS